MAQDRTEDVSHNIAKVEEHFVTWRRSEGLLAGSSCFDNIFLVRFGIVSAKGESYIARAGDLTWCSNLYWPRRVMLLL